MELHNAIARWESEGGAIPQVQRSRKPKSQQIRPLTMRRILVPIDFSPESLKALRYAKRLVERFKAKLHMVHVVTPPLAVFPQPRQVLPPNFTEEMVGDAIDRFEEVVRDFSLPLRHRHYTVRIGAVAHEINEVARITRTDFIAIATRGYTGLKRAFLGSTTESVVRNAPCPVLVVREKEHGPRNQRARKAALQVRKILVPLDFSEASRLGLEYALTFAQEFHATLVLFHSIFVTAYVMGNRHTAHHVPTLIANQQEYARREMEELREAISRKVGVAEIKIAVGSAVEQIGKYVKKTGVDLIITSTHGRTGLRRVFIGSTAERLVRYATCPVLVVPNRAAGKMARAPTQLIRG
jgi:nucleotide-binding universal stress UspA family protein